MSGPWYWCLDHHKVEPEDGCANDRRMGPYETVQEAERAPERAKARSEQWDRDDEADRSWGRDAR
jgi:hypothetical protein